MQGRATRQEHDGENDAFCLRAVAVLVHFISTERVHSSESRR